jgi:2-amino-4-hydroxy-6-hydroxymethyldihydropteridine diphosphokinase
MLNTAYLSLGSNIAPADNLTGAIRLLANLTDLIAVSSVWETAPLGGNHQPFYLNAAAIVQTEKTPQRLKTEVLDFIEQTLGRERQADKFAPRTIDIDIMLFNDQIFDMGHRHIPDAELVERAFVALPMAEIAPNYIHPETGQSLMEIAQSFKVNPDAMRVSRDISRVLSQILGDAQ